MKKVFSHSSVPIDSVDNIENTRKYFQSIISAMPNNVYWLDRDCIAQGCNQNVLDLIGLDSLDEFIGISYREMGKLAGWVEGQAKSFEQDDREVMATGKPKLNVEEPPLCDRRGNIVYYLSNRVPLFNSRNEVIGVVGISVDITERKNMEVGLRKAKEEAELANQAKTAFIENMSHDIVTPLSGILGLAGSIAHQTELAEVKETATLIEGSSRQLLHMLQGMLISIVNLSGKLEIQRFRFSIEALCDYIITLYSASLKHKGLSIRYDCDPDIPEMVVGDPTLIKVILGNLLSNAIKFTHKGHVALGVRLIEQTETEVMLRFTVEDTGIGIPANKIETIYEKFTRLSPSFTSKSLGTGLGLSIVKEFANKIGAKLDVRSELDKGTAFTCTLPLHTLSLGDESLDIYSFDIENGFVEREYEKIINNNNVEVLQSSVKTKTTKLVMGPQQRVLLVEDNEIAQRVACLKLGEINCIVDIASNSSEALSYAKSRNYNIVFMDIGLPDKDGYQTTAAIREWEAAQGRLPLPIIALTAHVSAQSSGRCFDAGMNGVLIKPLTPEKIMKLIPRVVGSA